MPIGNHSPVQLTCGYNGPLVSKTVITWYQNSRILGQYKPRNPPTVSQSTLYNLTSSSKGIGLHLTTLMVYSQYRCSIATPGQLIFLVVNLTRQSDYQLRIVGPYNVIESKEFILECVATFTLGNSSSRDYFQWYQIGQQSQILVADDDRYINIENRGTRSILHITSIRRSDLKNYRTTFRCSYYGNADTKHTFHSVYILSFQNKSSTCRSQMKDGYFWPESQAGAVVYISCRDNKIGNASRKCYNNFTGSETNYWGAVSVIHCTSSSFWTLQQEASRPNAENYNATAILSRLQALTDPVANRTLISGDILASTSILQKLINIEAEQPVQASDTYNFIKIASNLIDLRNRAQWMEIQQEQPGTTKLSQILELLARRIDVDNRTIIIATENIAIEISAISTETNQSYHFPGNTFKPIAATSSKIYLGKKIPAWLNGNDITLPSSLFQEYEHSSKIKIVSLAYKTLNELFPARIDPNLRPNFEYWTPNTLIISTSLYPPPQQDLEESVVYTLKKLSINESWYDKKQFIATEEFSCVFWNYSKGREGAWSDEGCSLVYLNSTHLSCQCDHLTNFAVLMRLSERNNSQAVQFSLEMITYFGCGISVIALTATLIIYGILWKYDNLIPNSQLNCNAIYAFKCRYLKNPTNKIHMNLFAWMVIPNMIIMVVDLAKNIKVLCAILACILHFSLLTTFMWMLIEGIHLYLVLIKVFDVNEKFLYYNLGAVGIPALVAVPTIVINCGIHSVDFYLSTQGCWLSAKNWIILSFIIPFACIFVANIIFCVMAIHTILHTQKISADAKKLHKIKIALRGLTILTPVLGLTWSFGCLLLLWDSPFVQYLFAITNSLQGLCVFLVYCLFNHNVQEAYQKYRNHSKKLAISSDKPGFIVEKLTEPQRHNLDSSRKNQADKGTIQTCTSEFKRSSPLLSANSQELGDESLHKSNNSLKTISESALEITNHSPNRNNSLTDSLASSTQSQESLQVKDEIDEDSKDQKSSNSDCDGSGEEKSSPNPRE
ncbi:uncharacterized protein TRIADDRAFT_62264 [Trichoplax adhaerens]|uniref:Adhesion G protein-coupled receptor L3 n=1 Tax=Trichoplax adhaerens TaxID=10228 RepID=B3SDA6_TRIAD|nr:hypothetical protein TRIADDRAFT_62264 [Trichoplax adhaerens]EDV19310.1 hypothetical protein TRIADDRAFT_62264 [Trichoplax adhaerens]|eukprot:XP_002118234.1 hypothetical protein TRIADDRAFT_62264 [Trichoplax adhaerens]